MRFRSNTADNWELNWTKSELQSQNYRKSVWDVINEIKFGYLRRLIPSGGLCLEVGCGIESLLNSIAGLGWNGVGIDYSPTALKLAHIRLINTQQQVDLIRGNAYNLPFRNQSFDLVMSTGLLEHFRYPQPIVKEMIRVLRPGGIFYSDIVPRKFSLLRALDNIKWSSKEKLGLENIFERRFSKVEIEKMLYEMRTLENLSVFPAGVFPPRKLFSKRIMFTSFAEYPVSKVFGLLSSVLDGTWVAELLGFYYFVIGTKS